MNNVTEAVVRYLLDNFDIVKVASRTNGLRALRARREFGFDLEHPYYKLKKSPEEGKACVDTECPEFDKD